MNANSASLDATLRALADERRRAILELLRDGEWPVGEIARSLDMSQQAISHHLTVMRGAGLVTERREGAKHLYAVEIDGLRVVDEYLGGFWPAQLGNLKRAAEATARRARG